MTRILLVLCLLATPASAEINMADAIEWQTIDADVVVRGFVTSVNHVRTKNLEWQDLTFQITESIKGGVKQTLRFAVRLHYPADRWRKLHTDLLLFLRTSKSISEDANEIEQVRQDIVRFSYGLRDDQGDTHNALELGAMRAVTSTFGAVEKPTDVLAAVRAAIKSTATESQRVDAPWNTPAQKALYGGSTVWMTVPVDATLEKHALAWLENAGSREQGLFAIVHFKSDANIARVKKLLVDPNGHVRAAADDALDRWHVPHTEPK